MSIANSPVVSWDCRNRGQVRGLKSDYTRHRSRSRDLGTCHSEGFPEDAYWACLNLMYPSESKIATPIPRASMEPDSTPQPFCDEAHVRLLVASARVARIRVVRDRVTRNDTSSRRWTDTCFGAC